VEWAATKINELSSLRFTFHLLVMRGRLRNIT